MMTFPPAARRSARLLISAFFFGLVPAAADEAGPVAGPPATALKSDCHARTSLPAPAAPMPAGEPGRHLPLDSVTRHRLDLPGRTLCFTATAGSIRLVDGQGQSEAAEVAYIAYELESTTERPRPVTFVLNGGPGISSAWLQLGGVGPWRLPMAGDAVAPSAAPDVIDNAETWLDFTDLVFLDPVGTGYSRSLLSGDDARHRFWSVDGDIETLTEVIWRWLLKNKRMASPKYYLGESYGGFRGPRLAHALRTERGVALNGLVLVSPVLDFGRFNGSFNTFDWVAHLPSYAATALSMKGPVTRAALAEAETYAEGDYLSDLLRGVNDAAAVARISARVAALTGLDLDVVRRLEGRISAGAFQREIDRKAGRVASIYDATVTGFDPSPGSQFSRFPDPLLEALDPPLTSAMLELYERRLGWQLDSSRYFVINNTVTHSWDWGRGEPDAISDLREALALDPRIRVLITHGFTDLITPYFETKMLLDQIPSYGDPPRLRLVVYQGGHMHYLRDESRIALRADAQALIEGR
ncbi:MAG: peptidase S10 [Methylobacteriaceae bacterium]|nr:peptidase S10 [Methylobacteriaceae bacterium]